MTQRTHASRGEPLAWLMTVIATPWPVCVDWQYGVQGVGYGSLWFKGQTRKASAVVCELVYGPKPSRIHQARHLCGRPICVNPRHLRWGTPKENNHDKYGHGTDGRGARNSAAVFTDEDVRAIRAEAAAGPWGIQKKLARRYGVTESAISDIVTGTNWKWLT